MAVHILVKFCFNINESFKNTGKAPKEWKCASENEVILMDPDEICYCNASRYTLAMTIVSEVCDIIAI